MLPVFACPAVKCLLNGFLPNNISPQVAYNTMNNGVLLPQGEVRLLHEKSAKFRFNDINEASIFCRYAWTL